MHVFLADPGHNKVTVSSDVHPLGVANLATYAKAHLEHPEPVEFRIFREPETAKAGRVELIGNRIRTFGEHASGLGKFTRTMFAQDLRRTAVPIALAGNGASA